MELTIQKAGADASTAQEPPSIQSTPGFSRDQIWELRCKLWALWAAPHSHCCVPHQEVALPFRLPEDVRERLRLAAQTLEEVLNSPPLFDGHQLWPNGIPPSHKRSMDTGRVDLSNPPSYIKTTPVTANG